MGRASGDPTLARARQREFDRYDNHPCQSAVPITRAEFGNRENIGDTLRRTCGWTMPPYARSFTFHFLNPSMSIQHALSALSISFFVLGSAAASEPATTPEPSPAAKECPKILVTGSNIAKPDLACLQAAARRGTAEKAPLQKPVEDGRDAADSPTEKATATN
jgi:hypothetical protein